jgi:hypothetical protein
MSPGISKIFAGLPHVEFAEAALPNAMLSTGGKHPFAVEQLATVRWSCLVIRMARPNSRNIVCLVGNSTIRDNLQLAALLKK